ncbi:hypothetical protein CISG_06191 [Coccidioides immitis RMSCC 3703]|uniref:Uncharacterized protein n=2 Tax=Coccidioides immitis TaxID=5501 RepID=A0A0J8QWB3_COCIT|nr:hypothetical protein CIRG_10025 [Coccidioides immitis RMSCC 2394]KMU77154.1 hypothetical protein CISG_06191 [Coccidioides immitis RMSCC 3703]
MILASRWEQHNCDDNSAARRFMFNISVLPLLSRFGDKIASLSDDYKGRVLIILGLRGPDQIDQLGELLSQQWIKEALKCSRTTEHELNTFMPLLSPTLD